jgi:branched-subunit amino acid ABC-type transport system permease component
MYSQTVINTIIAASSYTLVGISFYLTFSVARFYHFTHGAFFALGAYTTYVLASTVGLPLIASTVLTIAALSLMAAAMDRLLYRRIRKSGGGPFIPLLASLGLYTVIQNAISMFYGDSALILPGARDWSVFNVPGGRITVPQLAQLVLAVVAVVASWLFMKRTLSGRQMRAVGQDRDLSLALGLPVDRLISLSFAVGYGMAVMAGVVAAVNVDLMPTMGMRPMMMGMVAMIIGGISLWGTVCGAVLLAVAQHAGVIWLPTQWQDAIAFVFLIIILLARLIGRNRGAR